MKISQIIDLTYPIHEGMTSFAAAWHPGVSITQIGRHGFEGRETRKISFGSHTGTHVDAPLHFVSQGLSIDSVSLKILFGEISILDFSHLGKNEAVSYKMLTKIKFKKRILIKFGWGKYWNSKYFYKDYPYISKEAAQYLIKKGVIMIGMDTPSPDDSRIQLSGEILGSESDSPIHKLFLRNNIILVEYIANLDLIKSYAGWNIIAFPLKLKGVDGSPARVCIFK
jgi:arylformamidase